MKTQTFLQSAVILMVVSILTVSCQKEEMLIPISGSAIQPDEAIDISEWELANATDEIDGGDEVTGDPGYETGSTIEATGLTVEELNEAEDGGAEAAWSSPATAFSIRPTVINKLAGKDAKPVINGQTGVPAVPQEIVTQVSE